MLRKLASVALIGAVALTASLPTTASAHFYYHPKPVVIAHSGGTSAAAGVGATSGFIGFVAILAGYDLLRRTTCIGDPWGLGGPGFTEKLPNGNVMIPQCRIVKPARAVVRARG